MLSLNFPIAIGVPALEFDLTISSLAYSVLNRVAGDYVLLDQLLRYIKELAAGKSVAVKDRCKI
jgi:hypothetical protein